MLKPKSFLHPRFFYYQLHTAKLDSLGYARHYRLLKEHGVSYPAYAEQCRIVAILDEAFEGIATARAIAEKNLLNAGELLMRYLQSTFSSASDGWPIESVGSIAECSLGKMLDKTKNKGALRPYLRNLNVRWFGFDLTDVREMRFTADERERYSVRRGDVVVCEGGYPGRAAIWLDDEPIFIQKALHRVRFSDQILGKWFLFYLYSLEASGTLRKFFTGTGIQHFTGAALARLEMPVPPSDVTATLVAQFEAMTEAVAALKELYQSKLAALDELKKSVLSQAFSGALSTASAEVLSTEAI